MTAELKVHPSFFREFATKTWVSPNEIVKELVENAFDEDATRVLITLLKDGSVVIEDDAGMNQNDMEKFLLLGSPHKRQDSISPKLKRLRTGRYGTGRLSFLTSFQNMKIRTCREGFTKSIVIDADSLDKLFTGNAKLQELDEPSLQRNGTELTMSGSKVSVEAFALTKEIRKLAILRHPMFEVYIKTADDFREWDFSSAQLIRAPDIQRHRLPVNLDNGRIMGEVVIARRPLSEDEKGIAVMVGNHIVTRSNFGFDTKLNRVTGNVRCDMLTSRFADKSALIEDEQYEKFIQTMKTFVIDTVLPSLTEYEDVLITREESKIYKEIDKVLGQAIVENLETQEEVQGYEMVDVKEVLESGNESSAADNKSYSSIPTPYNNSMQGQEKVRPDNISEEISGNLDQGVIRTSDLNQLNQFEELQPIVPTDNNQSGVANVQNENQNKDDLSTVQSVQQQQQPSDLHRDPQLVTTTDSPTTDVLEVMDEKQADGTLVRTRRVRKPIVKKTFALKKIGYKVIPYEDESDSRYSFTNENVVFVNKANSTYRAESSRGDEFLMRHIISIVAEAIAEAKHPEGKEALELQNRLVAEAIRIHDYSIMKK